MALLFGAFFVPVLRVLRADYGRFFVCFVRGLYNVIFLNVCFRFMRNFAVSKDKKSLRLHLHKRQRLNKAQTSLALSSACSFIDLLIQKNR